MKKPERTHPFRTPVSEYPLKGVPTSKTTQKQRNIKRTRDRIELFMEQQEFDKEWEET